MPLQSDSSRTLTAGTLWRVVQYLIELCHAGAYCRVTLRLQAGRVVMVTTDRDYKPDDLPVTDAAAGQKHLAHLPY